MSLWYIPLYKTQICVMTTDIEQSRCDIYLCARWVIQDTVHQIPLPGTYNCTRCRGEELNALAIDRKVLIAFTPGQGNRHKLETDID